MAFKLKTFSVELTYLQISCSGNTPKVHDDIIFIVEAASA